MVKLTTNPTHSIGWVDFAASDLDASKEFYAGLFGWTYFQDDDNPYLVCMVDESPVAGMMALTPEMGDMPPGWSVYVPVENLEASIKVSTDAGGMVYQPPFEVDADLRMAVIGDPRGGAICLFEGLGDSGLKLQDEVGASCWYDCLSRDVPGAVEFYSKLFGWTTEEVPMGDDGVYTIFSREGEQTCGIVTMPDQVPEEVPSHWIVNFSVADVDIAAKYVTDNGGTITMPAVDTPYGRRGGLMDPWGAPLNVMDRSRAAQ